MLNMHGGRRPGDPNLAVTRRSRSRLLSRAFAILAYSTFIGAVALGVPSVAFAAPTAVDMAQARELLNMGLAMRGKGDALGALEKLKAAYALVRTPITGLELGRTYLVLGRLVEARETFLSNSRIPERVEETAKSKAARSESDQLAEQLRVRIASLTVKIVGVPMDSVAVTIDGSSVPSEALAAPRLVDPGTHTVSARSTSGGTAETTLNLKEGEERDVELRIMFTGGSQPPVAQPNPASSPRRDSEVFHSPDFAPRSNSHVLEWSLIGGGAAVGIAGAVLMVVEAGNASNAASQKDKSTYDSSNSMWSVGLVASIVGGAAIATGGVLFLTDHGDSGMHGSRPSVWVGLGAGVVRVGGSW
jgi:hypothetical protein